MKITDLSTLDSLVFTTFGQFVFNYLIQAGGVDGGETERSCEARGTLGVRRAEPGAHRPDPRLRVILRVFPRLDSILTTSRYVCADGYVYPTSKN